MDDPILFTATCSIAPSVEDPLLRTRAGRRQGRLTPNGWMEQAIGSPVSSAPLLRDLRSATRKLMTQRLDVRPTGKLPHQRISRVHEP